MNFQGNYRRLGKIDILPIKALVDQLTIEHWMHESIRQNRYEVHKDTQFIGVVYDEDFRHINPTRRPALNLFGPVLRPAFKLIANYYESAPDIMAKFDRPIEGYFVRVSFTKLLAGGEILEHRDKNFSLTHSHRVHIPIITNKNVIFTVGGEKSCLKAGEIVEINNRRNHSVVNQGKDDRVHLILDWVFPWEPCCCRDKTHPDVPCSPQACIATVRLQTPCNCFPESAD